MIQIMKLVEYKHSLVSLRTENLKKLEKESSKRIKELENEIKKTKTLIDKSNQLIKTKCLKWFFKKILPTMIRHEKHKIKNKTDKNWKINWNNALFRV